MDFRFTAKLALLNSLQRGCCKEFKLSTVAEGQRESHVRIFMLTKTRMPTYSTSFGEWILGNSSHQEPKSPTDGVEFLMKKGLEVTHFTVITERLNTFKLDNGRDMHRVPNE